jgi:hypothetical protein
MNSGLSTKYKTSINKSRDKFFNTNLNPMQRLLHFFQAAQLPISHTYMTARSYDIIQNFVNTKLFFVQYVKHNSLPLTPHAQIFQAWVTKFSVDIVFHMEEQNM